MKFRPYVDFMGSYSSGLATVGVNEQGALADQTAYGMRMAWGIGGLRSGKRTKVGLDYRGSLAHYLKTSAYDSVEQSFLLGVTHQLSRHTVLNLRESAGIFSRDFGLLGLSQSLQYDPTRSSYIPKTDYFDNRTIYSSTQLDMQIQQSARTSFNLGGGLSATRRRSQALNGSTVVSAYGDVQRRMTRMTTIGGGYTFAHHTFSRTYGSADVHTAFLSFARQLSRHVELTAYAGASRLETMFIETVPIDPAIAALLGLTSAVQIVHQIHYSPNGGARISRAFKDGSVYASVSRAVSAGNGLFLTSEVTAVDVGYSYTGFRRWSLSVSSGWSRATSFGTIGGGYESRSGGVAAGRQVTRSIHLVSNYSIRRHSSGTFARYNRTIQEATVGIRLAPGAIPLRVW